MSKKIDLLNNLIEQAIMHGADAGGAYFQNEDGLREAIQEYLSFERLDDYFVEKLSWREITGWTDLVIRKKKTSWDEIYDGEYISRADMLREIDNSPAWAGLPMASKILAMELATYAPVSDVIPAKGEK